MTFTQYQLAQARENLLLLDEGQSLLLVQPSTGNCAAGQHELCVTGVTDPSKTNIFGLQASRTLIFCRKCPFHYFPEPPNEADEADNESEIAENGLQND